MKFEQVQKAVAGIPFIEPANARALYDFILQHELHTCLELGFAHGVASCYIAAALDEIGRGTLTSVDLKGQEHWQRPAIEELLGSLGLEGYVDVHREATGYNWFLHDTIAANTREGVCTPIYDLCIIDGPKNWTIDSSAFFLADKLLKSGGWLIFDDYAWTYADADTRRDSTDGIAHRMLSEVDRQLPHIKEIFHLLVMQHPDYSDFVIQADGDWAWAHKVRGATKNVSYKYSEDYRDVAAKAFHRAKRFLAGRR